MTADEIIDALGKCKQSFTPATYWYKTMIKACRFIKRQNAEIARLQQTQNDIDNFARSLCEERVLKGKAIANFEDLQEYIRKEQSKAVKEFADQFITDFNEDIENYTKAGQRHEITDDIDGWLKYYIRAKLYKTEETGGKMNDISPMDKTFLILIGIIVIGHLVDKFIEYLRYQERLKNEHNILVDKNLCERDKKE